MTKQAEIGLTGYIPFNYFQSSWNVAGSTWLRFAQINALDNNFERWIQGKKYDNLIFQKSYWPEMMALFEGPKILDLCDPDWFSEELDILEICKGVHAITCSSPELTELMKGYLPDKIVEHVPDRLNIDSFPPPRKKHEGKPKEAVWFGYIHNAHETLGQLVSFLSDNGLNLTIISNVPYEQEDYVLGVEYRFIQYDRTTVYDHLKEADVVLNPRSGRAPFRYKSNNKSLISWQLGIPVAVTTNDLERLMDPVERNREVEEKQAIVVQDYDIRQSIGQYKSLFERIRQEFF